MANVVDSCWCLGESRSVSLQLTVGEAYVL